MVGIDTSSTFVDYIYNQSALLRLSTWLDTVPTPRSPRLILNAQLLRACSSSTNTMVPPAPNNSTAPPPLTNASTSSVRRNLFSSHLSRRPASSSTAHTSTGLRLAAGTRRRHAREGGQGTHREEPGSDDVPQSESGAWACDQTWRGGEYKTEQLIRTGERGTTSTIR
jgi:hypothetical protein